MFETSMIVAILVSFAVTVALCPIAIPFLKGLKAGQTEREEGVQSHLKKAGTPTMGGIVILIAVSLTSLFYVGEYPKVLPVLLLMLGFGAVGFVDDYLKVVLRRSDGFMPVQKMACQIVITAAFAAYMVLSGDNSLDMIIPFSGGYSLHLPVWATIPFMFLVIVGTANGTNFTDGLDGLATTVTSIVSMFFILIAAAEKSSVMPLPCAMLGALLGFLIFNAYPARIFMGDTGSLALGGFVVGCAYMLKAPLFIVIVGIIYLVEVLSVMIQVTYYKKTGGKRLFKMAPIHHHFELCGWSETKVVAVFSIVTAILCFIGLAAY